MNDAAADSFEAREEEVLDAARQLVARHPDVGAVLCECTNFGPHSAAIARELSLPVWSGLVREASCSFRPPQPAP